MRARDIRILDELEMLYGDKDCFYPLHDWFGTAEIYWVNLVRLFSVADYAKTHHPVIAEQIATFRDRITILFQQTKDYASVWNSKDSEKRRLTTRDYVEATDETWDALENWTASQEKLRQAVLAFVRFLSSATFEM